MTSIAREHIPFFDDELSEPVQAIVAKLWDAARRPDFNSVQAYPDFITAIGDEGLQAPSRALFRRFVAGAQAGLISRPGGPLEHAEEGAAQGRCDVLAGPTVPLAVLLAVQAAWDRAQNDGFTDEFLHASLHRDVAASGYTAPTQHEFRKWLKAVRAGKIERPGTALEPKAKGKQERNYVPVDPADSAAKKRIAGRVARIDDKIHRMADVCIADPETGTPSQPVIAAEIDDKTRKIVSAAFGDLVFTTLMEANISPPEPGDERPDPALALVARQMVEEEVARINMSVRAQATAIVAARLRQMAVCLEGGAL